MNIRRFAQPPARLTIKPDRSPTAQTCDGCLSIGIPALDAVIQPNESHFTFSDEHKTLRCCADCFDRLREEIEKRESK